MSHQAEEFYRGANGRAYQEGKRSIPPIALPWVARLRAEKFQHFVKPSDTVVEPGAGQGWNLAELRCARRIAADLEDFLPLELKQQGVEYLSSTENLPAGRVDVVICHHMLEHVANPPTVLAEARRLLRRDGILLLHVPFEKERRYRKYDPREPNHHLYSWNVQTLGNLTTTQGFQLREAGVGCFGYDRFAAALAVRLGIGEAGFRAVRRLAHGLRPGLEVRIVAAKTSD